MLVINWELNHLVHSVLNRCLCVFRCVCTSCLELQIWMKLGVIFITEDFGCIMLLRTLTHSLMQSPV